MIYTKSEDIVFTELGNGIKVINISNFEKDEVIEITGLAAKIFLLCDGETSLSDILLKLKISQEENKDDLTNLINFLKTNSLIY